jgi:hypothetical protein
MGIVTRTVGLDVGTGRGGMCRFAALLEEAAGTAAVDADPEGDAEGVIVHAPASRSSRGPDLSQAPAQAARATTRKGPRMVGRILDPRRPPGKAVAAPLAQGSCGPRGPILIPERAVRKASLAVLCALAMSGATSARAEQDVEAPGATMTCERATGAGRVTCEVEAVVEAGASIAWGDLVLLRLPPFVSALRARVGPHDASVREPRRWRWTFAVVARAKGSGALDGRVRIVVCGANGCAARLIDVTGRVDVGATTPPLP